MHLYLPPENQNYSVSLWCALIRISCVPTNLVRVFEGEHGLWPRHVPHSDCAVRAGAGEDVPDQLVPRETQDGVGVAFNGSGRGFGFVGLHNEMMPAITQVRQCVSWLEGDLLSKERTYIHSSHLAEY